MGKDLADFAMNYALQLGSSYAEARYEEGKGIGFGLENGVLTSSATGETKGLGFRVLVDGAQAFGATDKLTKQNVRELVERAVRSARYSSNFMKRPIIFSDEKMYHRKYGVKQRKKLANVSAGEKVEFLRKLYSAIKSSTSLITSATFDYSDVVISTYYVNSEGAKILSEIPEVDLSYIYTLSRGAKSLQRYYLYMEDGGWERLERRDLRNKLPAEAQRMAKVLTKGVRPPRGMMDVLLGSEVIGIMTHESAGHPYEADRILGREAAQAGESFITQDLLGTRIGSDEVTIVDTPLVKNSPGYYLFDAEGVKARDKVLIKKGIINEFLHNRNTASRTGFNSNAAARSEGYGREPLTRMSNTFLKPGRMSEDALLREMKYGIYMKNYMEWNIDDKRLNQRYIGCEAYIVKNGEIVAPVTSPTLEISTPDLWQSIVARGNKRTFGLHSGPCGMGEPMQTVRVGMGGPIVLLKKVRMY